MSDDAILKFYGLARVLAEQDLQPVRARWMDTLDHVGTFPFDSLPVEIAVVILKLATTKSSAYSVLMRTSRGIAALVRFECVPESVVLSNRQSAISFYMCISVHPGVGAAVKQLWFIPALTSKQSAIVGPAILSACFHLKRLVCFPQLVIDICNANTFRHVALMDLTLVASVMPWQALLGTHHGATFFNQIRNMRLIAGNGGTPPAIPPHGTSFLSLCELTITSGTTACVQTYLLNLPRFPNLTRVVVTVSYMDWRDIGPNFLMTEPELADTRLCVVHCPKKWKELEIWKKGPFAIWNMGVTEWNTRARDTGAQPKAWK
ncbi:hypothetical protein B0H15DRAFT_998324 [Mycena belliarum]|uniref:Uncharacterized protein n=1 Tax=Mycena belliarum TaxID=1033014 RepID=A0AAD6TUB5_9AGAR|nr:hypothetical protein B0H15DRAFT_998324 [Mycena belliae]